MGYKVIDCHLDKYFWDGHIFKDKKEIVEALSSFHDVDFSGVIEKTNKKGEKEDFEVSIEEYLKHYFKNDTEKSLNYLLEYGEWELEEINHRF